MLLIVDKSIRGGICHSIYRCAIAYNKYMQDHDKDKEPSYLKHCGVNSFYGWAMLEKLPVYNSGWIKDTSQFSEHFLKSYSQENDEGCFIEVGF